MYYVFLRVKNIDVFESNLDEKNAEILYTSEHLIFGVMKPHQDTKAFTPYYEVADDGDETTQFYSRVVAMQEAINREGKGYEVEVKFFETNVKESITIYVSEGW